MNSHWKRYPCGDQQEENQCHELKERMVIDKNRSIIEVTHRIHSITRDRSLSLGLKSSLLKLSLLVSGSMPTCSKTDDQWYNTQPAHKVTWHFLCPPKRSLGIAA